MLTEGIFDLPLIEAAELLHAEKGSIDDFSSQNIQLLLQHGDIAVRAVELDRHGRSCRRDVALLTTIEVTWTNK